MPGALLTAGLALALGGAYAHSTGRPGAAIVALIIAWIVLTAAAALSPPSDWTH